MGTVLRPVPERVCDSCASAVMEQAEEIGLDLSWAEADSFARDWGADVADHLCDARENGKMCGCACRVHDRPCTKSKRHV